MTSQVTHPPVIDAQPVLVPVVFAEHACRWCGTNACADRGGHDWLLRTSETYNRQPVTERNACPRCGGDVRFGGQCVAYVREWVTE